MEFIGIIKENDVLNKGYIDSNFSKIEADRVFSKSSPQTRKRTFLGILSLKHLIKNRLDEEVTIYYPIQDKPILIDKNKNISPYDFSISHSHELVSCIISKNKIGIDIEKIRTINFDIMSLVFTEDEINYVLSKVNYKNERLFKIWTSKESFIKLIGKGLRYPLKDINFIENNKLADRLVIDKEKYYLKRFPFEDYMITICSNAEIKLDLKIFNREYLLYI